MAFPVTLNGRTYTLADFSGTNYVEGFPDALEDFVTQAGNIYTTTSTSSVAIGTGTKTFTVADSAKPYTVGTPLRIADAAAPATNWIDAIVTSYSGTTLEVNAIAYAGSGTISSWNINIGGSAVAYTGTLPVAQGGTGATTEAAARTNLNVYSKSEADAKFLDVSGEASNVTMTGDVTIGDTSGDTLTVNATATLADATLTTADINGGTIDGVTIGGASAGAATFTSATVNGNPIATAGSLSSRNKIINGAMQVAQRGTNFAGGTTNADDAYTLDRWYVLSEGSDSIDVDQVADSPDTGGKCIRLDVETTGEKFGIAQIVEASNCTGLIGNTVTLSFAAKVSNARIDTVKAAVVAWSGTADTVTSDIISAWNADGTTPTLIANATFENTPADLGVTTSWATYEITATVDTSSTANLIVFIWSDDATNPLAGDFLYITNVQLEAGDVATPFEYRPPATEKSMCRYYYLRRTGDATNELGIPGYTFIASAQQNFIDRFEEMRVPPSFVCSAATDFYIIVNQTTINISTYITAAATDKDGALLITGETLGANLPASLHTDTGGTGWLAYDAEL